MCQVEEVELRSSKIELEVISGGSFEESDTILWIMSSYVSGRGGVSKVVIDGQEKLIFSQIMAIMISLNNI